MIEEIDAGAELVREFGRYLPVRVAFWLKDSDREFRYLYIASDRMDGSNISEAYGEVLRLADQLQSPHLDPFRVKIVNSQDPLARAAFDIQTRFPSRTPIRLGGMAFGGISVDDVCIYPAPVPAAVP